MRILSIICSTVFLLSCEPAPGPSKQPSPEGELREAFYNDPFPRYRGRVRLKNDRKTYRVGQWKWWHREGDLMISATFTENGKETGEWKYYLMDGSQWLTENYRDGRLHGKSTRFNLDGTIRWKKDYKNGKCVKTENRNSQIVKYPDN